MTRVDVKTGTDCRDVFRYDTGRYELVVHCAAVVGGRQTIEREPMRVATDLAIDSDFFQYVLRTRPRRSVYFSSSAAYPVELQTGVTPAGDRVRLAEDDIDLSRADEPDAIYGWVKLTGERLARHVNDLGAGVYVFRPFSGYGADQDLGYPFPDMLERARRKPATFHVWGNGQQVRDWVHISDIVNAVTQVFDWDPTAIGPLNICTGIGTPVGGLAQLFINTGGFRSDVYPRTDQPVGVMHRVGDPTNLHKIYEPRVTIEEGVERALRD